MSRFAASIAVAVLLASPAVARSPAADEKAVWSLEDAYWRYVQANDLEGYRTLWHSDFLGWPLTSPEPVRKAHITEWITAHASAGETLKSYELERLVAQATGDYVTVTYRVRMNWVGKDGVSKPSSLRVIHTWLHAGPRWQIISGMAAPPNADGR